MDTPFVEYLADYWYWALIGIVVLIILIKFLPRYKIAPPDTALIISGLIRRNYKVRNPDGTISAKRFGYRIIRGGATSMAHDTAGAMLQTFEAIKQAVGLDIPKMLRDVSTGGLIGKAAADAAPSDAE